MREYKLPSEIAREQRLQDERKTHLNQYVYAKRKNNNEYDRCKIVEILKYENKAFKGYLVKCAWNDKREYEFNAFENQRPQGYERSELPLLIPRKMEKGDWEERICGIYKQSTFVGRDKKGEYMFVGISPDSSVDENSDENEKKGIFVSREPSIEDEKRIVKDIKDKWDFADQSLENLDLVKYKNKELEDKWLKWNDEHRSIFFKNKNTKVKINKHDIEYQQKFYLDDELMK